MQTAAVGESLAVLGWNMSVSNLRFDGDYVLFDVDASPTQADGPHAKPEDIRFGLYGALAHPIEANAHRRLPRRDQPGGPAGCRPRRPTGSTGTVCLGPMRDQSQVRGVYVYSPKDRIAGTTVAYAAAFPVGLPPTNDNDTGLVVSTTSVDAFRADGAQLDSDRARRPDRVQRQGLHAAGSRNQRAGSAIPR